MVICTEKRIAQWLFCMLGVAKVSSTKPQGRVWWLWKSGMLLLLHFFKGYSSNEFFKGFFKSSLVFAPSSCRTSRVLLIWSGMDWEPCQIEHMECCIKDDRMIAMFKLGIIYQLFDRSMSLPITIPYKYFETWRWNGAQRCVWKHPRRSKYFLSAGTVEQCHPALAACWIKKDEEKWGTENHMVFTFPESA